MKRLTLIAVAVLAAIGLAGCDRNGNESIDVDDEGKVSTEAAAAGCLPIERAQLPKEPPGHVNGEVDYDVEPPSFGEHSPRTLSNIKPFYSRDDAPPPERAVHNLEHGVVVAWYDDELPDDQVAALEAVAPDMGRRFVAVPWTRSTFDDDRHFVLTAWGVTQRCRTVSAAVVEQFVDDHADTLAPEKGAPV